MQMQTQSNGFPGRTGDGEIQIIAINLSDLDQDSQPAPIAGAYSTKDFLLCGYKQK